MENKFCLHFAKAERKQKEVATLESVKETFESAGGEIAQISKE